MSRPFIKYEGLGNDFLVVDARDWPLSELTTERVMALCDRHTGVGGDGVLWMGPAEHGGDARLIILNADGSRPEMCGNGVRCVAAWLFDEGRLAVGQTLQLETDAGPRPASVLASDARTQTATVRVDMGPVRTADGAAALQADGCGAFAALPVDVGNPHAVVFDRIEESATLAVVRSVVAEKSLWPEGANVEFVARDGDGFVVRVHERGVGWTRACGTGAVAVAAAAFVRNEPSVALDRPVRITLPGGDLWITLQRGSERGLRALAQGPARRVFAGSVSLVSEERA